MAKQKLAFEEVNNINSLKKIYEDNSEYVIGLGYFNRKLLDKSFECMNNFDEKQEKYFLNLVHKVDKTMNLPGQANQGLFHKVPTLLASAIYIGEHFDKVKKYNYEELAYLSRFTASEPIESYDIFPIVFTKDILETTIKKTKSFFIRNELFELIYQKRMNNESEESVISHINNKTNNELTTESKLIMHELKLELGVISK